MDPNILTTAGWQLIDNTVAKLTVFVVLVIIGSFSVLLSRGVLPSLQITGEVADTFRLQRQVLLAVGLIAFLLAIIQFARAIVQAVAIIAPYYPRFGF